LLDGAREAMPDQERAAAMVSCHLCDLEAYPQKNETGVVDYGGWRKSGQRISSSAVESTVSRLVGSQACKSQHMCWSKRGAHLLFQVRCAAMNGDLLAGFQRWFPSVGTRRVMLPWDWLPTVRNGSFVITSDDRLDALVRRSPPGSGYSSTSTHT
jgi:hypothetical protein